MAVKCFKLLCCWLWKLEQFPYLNFSVKRFCVQVLKVVFSSLSQSQHTHNDLWAPSDRRKSQPWESCTRVSPSVSRYSIHQSVSQLSLSLTADLSVAQSLHRFACNSLFVCCKPTFIHVCQGLPRFLTTSMSPIFLSVN